MDRRRVQEQRMDTLESTIQQLQSNINTVGMYKRCGMSACLSVYMSVYLYVRMYVCVYV